MDDDPVLRALGEELEREDPDLAARLTAGPGAAPVRRASEDGPGYGLLCFLVLGAVGAVAAPFLLGPAAFGLMALLVLFGCPFAISQWLLDVPREPGDGPDDGPDIPPPVLPP